MPAVDEARQKMREVNGEMHVVKNRLFKLIMDEKGLDYGENFWEENNVISFAFGDAPGVAKTLSDLSKSEVFDIRMGYMDEKLLSASQVKAISRSPDIARYARHAARYDHGLSFTIGQDLGRTGSFNGRSCQSFLRRRPGCRKRCLI